MYFSKITFDISGTTCLQIGKSGQSEHGAPQSSPPLVSGWVEWERWGWLRSLLTLWLTAGSFPPRDMPVPSFVLSLLLVGCVTEPVQLAKQAKPTLTAVVCCWAKLALEGPSESRCWLKEEGRTLRAAERKEKGMELLVLVGLSSYRLSSVVELNSIEETLL